MTFTHLPQRRTHPLPLFPCPTYPHHPQTLFFSFFSRYLEGGGGALVVEKNREEEEREEVLCNNLILWGISVFCNDMGIFFEE